RMSNDMRNNGRQADSLTVAVLGTGRMAGIHLAALAELRDRGLQVDGRRVSIEPAVYGRDTEKVRAIAAQHRVARTSTRLEVLFGYMVPQTVVNRPTWFYKKEEAGGGIIEDMMAHFFDLLRYLVGPIDAVYAATGIAWETRREPDGTPFTVEVEDLASVSIRFGNGVIGNCFASWVR